MSFFLNLTGMSLGNFINSFGLILDIIGAILIFKYGIPEKISRKGEIFFTGNEEDEDEKLVAKKYDYYSRIGLILIIIGFSLQLLSNFIN